MDLVGVHSELMQSSTFCKAATAHKAALMPMSAAPGNNTESGRVNH